MGWRRTDCLAKPLSGLFGKLGSLVGSYPFYFFVFPLILSAVLSGGFIFLEDREDNDFERQYTPRKGPSKATRTFVSGNFPYNDSMFSEDRLYNLGDFASVIAVSTDNILENPAFEEIIRLNNKILNITVNSGTLRFNELCAKTNGKCVSNTILEIVSSNETNQSSITFPVHAHGSSSVFLGSVLGGVITGANDSVISAQAVKLIYYLANNESITEHSNSWLSGFKTLLSDEMDNKHIKVRITLLLALYCVFSHCVSFIGLSKKLEHVPKVFLFLLVN